MLANPPASEWLGWRRTQDGAGFSPLTQITKANVGELRTGVGVVAAERLERGDAAVSRRRPVRARLRGQAAGARCRDRRPAVAVLATIAKGSPASVKRHIALHGDKVLVATSDVHVVALECPHWEGRLGQGDRGRQSRIRHDGRANDREGQGDCRHERPRAGWQLHRRSRRQTPARNRGASTRLRSPASRAATAGTACRSRSATADRSGWRAATTRRPISCTSVWRRPTTPAPTAIWFRKAGVTNDLLYTDSTVAINPDTGKLVWHFQHQPNDQWDFDWAFGRVLFKMPVGGTTKTVVATSASRPSTTWSRRRQASTSPRWTSGLQNVVLNVDPRTGAKAINPG